MRAMQASLLTRFGSAAAVAVLATGGAMATATAASAAGHPTPKPKHLDATTLSIKNKAIARHRHHAEQIIGVLRDERKGVPNETITLDSRTGKKRRWTLVTTGTTDATGTVTITIAAPTTRTQFKLVFGGDPTLGFGKSHSNVITINGVKKK